MGQRRARAPSPTKSSTAPVPRPSPTTFARLAQPRLSAAQMGRRRLQLGHRHNGDRSAWRRARPDDSDRRRAGHGQIVAGRPAVRAARSFRAIASASSIRKATTGPSRRCRASIMLGGDDPPPRARDLVAALRHPGRQRRHRPVEGHRITTKTEYLNTLLPLLMTLRRQTGLPHKILLDEAHYFLGGPDRDQLLDRRRAGGLHPRHLSGFRLRRSIRATTTPSSWSPARPIRTRRRRCSMCRPKPCTSVPPTCSAIWRWARPRCCPVRERTDGYGVSSSRPA